MVNRGNIFNQVIDLFSDDHFLKEYPLYIKFEGEIAVDSGGVQRDMLSAFWEEAYVRFFEGSSLLVPIVTQMLTCHCCQNWALSYHMDILCVDSYQPKLLFQL